MKHVIFIFLFIPTLMFGQFFNSDLSAAPPPPPPPSGNFDSLMVLKYDASNLSSHDRTATPTWFDLTSSPVNATSVNGANYTLLSGTIHTVNFDGSNDEYSVPDNNKLDITVGSWGVWVNFKSFNLNFIGLMDKYIGSTSGYMLDIASTSTKKARAVMYNGANRVAEGTTTLAINTWYYITGTYDGAALKVYVNGVLETTTSGLSGNIVANTSTISIGGDGASTNRANVYISEVYIHSRALTVTEILNNFNSTKTKYGL